MDADDQLIRISSAKWESAVCDTAVRNLVCKCAVLRRYFWPMVVGTFVCLVDSAT